MTCQCTQGCSGRCGCKKKGQACTPDCGCKGKCGGGAVAVDQHHVDIVKPSKVVIPQPAVVGLGGPAIVENHGIQHYANGRRRIIETHRPVVPALKVEAIRDSSGNVNPKLAEKFQTEIKDMIRGHEALLEHYHDGFSRKGLRTYPLRSVKAQEPHGRGAHAEQVDHILECQVAAFGIMQTPEWQPVIRAQAVSVATDKKLFAPGDAITGRLKEVSDIHNCVHWDEENKFNLTLLHGSLNGTKGAAFKDYLKQRREQDSTRHFSLTSHFLDCQAIKDELFSIDDVPEIVQNIWNQHETKVRDRYDQCLNDLCDAQRTSDTRKLFSGLADTMHGIFDDFYDIAGDENHTKQPA
jgi:hypothetical protein